MTPRKHRTTSRSTPDDVPRPTPDRSGCVAALRRSDPSTHAGLRRRRARTAATSRTLWVENEPCTAERGGRGGGAGAASPLPLDRIRSRQQGAAPSIILLSPPPRSRPRSGWDSKNGPKTPFRLCGTDVVSAWRSPSTEGLRTVLGAKIVDVVVVVELLRSSTHGFPRSNQRSSR